MIVVAQPRSGATRICMDMAKRIGIEFIGELNSRNTQVTTRMNKGIIHETNFNPPLSSYTYCKALKGDVQSICLVNGPGFEYMAPRADLIILRKDLRKAVLSFASYVPKLKCQDGLKVPEEAKANWLHYNIMTLLDGVLGLTNYLVQTPDAPILWYEDHFPHVNTRYDVSREMCVDIDNCIRFIYPTITDNMKVLLSRY